MNKNLHINRGTQGGFTLIELIVVIVILGILAATALPKFANLSGDARLASLNAAKGSIASASAMVHGKILVNPSAVVSNAISVEGSSVTVANTYPDVNGIATAAGLGTADYVAYPAGTSGTNKPTVPSGAVGFVPKSIDGTASATTCFVTYTAATSTTTPPVIAVSTTNSSDCQ